MKRLKKDKIKKILAFMVALALMVSCMPSAYTISASETFGDGTDELFTDGELESVPAAEESTPDVSSADQGKQVQQTALTYENDSVKVTAEAVEENSIPQDTTLKADTVNENSSVSYDTVSQKLSKAAEDKGSSLRGFFAFDVYFADADGNRVEPNGRVKVTIEYKTPASPEIADTANTNVTVEKLQYNNSTGETECYTLQPNEDLKVLNVSEAKQLQTVQVETSNAAVFAVMWDSPESADSEDNTDDNVEAEAEQPAGAGDFTDEENPSDPEPTEAPAVTETPAVTEAPAEDITEPDNGDSDPTITEEPSSDSMIVEVIAEEANLRVSPSTDAEVVATVAAGTRLTVLETVTAEDGTTWYKVSYEGAEAYVRSDVAQVVADDMEISDGEDSSDEVQQEKEVVFTKTVGNVEITATAASGVIAEDAELVVDPIGEDSDKYSEVADKLNADAENGNYTVAGFLAYDISFQDSEGNKIEPQNGTVKVSMAYKNAEIPDSVSEAEETQDTMNIAVMHFVEDGDGNVTEVVNMSNEGQAEVNTTDNGEIEKAKFETDSFSTFSIVWQSGDDFVSAQAIRNFSEIDTVDSNSDGINVDLFDYNASSINNNHTLQFSGGNGQSQSYNNWTGLSTSWNGLGDGNKAYLNIMKNKLATASDGNEYPQLAVGAGESTSYLFSPTEGVNGKSEIHTKVNKLFTKDKDGYYEYNSETNFAQYNSSSNSFNVYNVPGSSQNAIGTTETGAHGSFFPFNTLTNSLLNNTSINAISGSENYHFGMTMSADFLQPEGGKVNGNDMIFEFSGDDDVWVYVDGVLVLDIGGIHNAISGSINFATGAVKVGKQTDTNLKTLFENASADTSDFKGNTFADYTGHTINFYYLERGKGASNCHLKFNLTTMPEGTVAVEKQLSNTDKEKYANVEFKFQLLAQKILSTDPQSGKETYSENEYVPLGSAVLNDGNNTSIVFNDETINDVKYENVFTLKPGQRAIFSGLKKNRKYKVQEIGVKSTEYDKILINKVEVKDQDGNITSGEATVANRPLVIFTNNCSAANSRELQITKQIKNNITVTDTFDFKVQLNGLNYTGDYYLKDSQGNYYVRKADGTLENKGKSSNSSPVCGTAENGIISSVPAGYTVAITHILSGTPFKVEEVNLNRNDYGAPEYKVEKATVKENPEVAEGTIQLGYNAQVTVTNTLANVAELVIKKVNAKGEVLSGAEFTLTSQADESKTYTATSGEDGIIRFENLPSGTYTLTETKVPNNYENRNTWIVKVEKNEAGEAVATLYGADGTTAVDKDKDDGFYHIVNYTHQELIESDIEYSKTAHVTDWENRKYQIDISAASKSTSTTTETHSADVVLVLDVSGSMNDSLGEYVYVGTNTAETRAKLNTSGTAYYLKIGNSYYQMSYSDRNGWQANYRNLNSYYSGYKIYSRPTRLQALKSSVEAFITSLAEKAPKSKVGITAFSSVHDYSVNNGTTKELQAVGANKDSLIAFVNDLKAGGGTVPAGTNKKGARTGLYKAKDMLDEITDNSSNNVILFTDGAPTGNNTGDNPAWDDNVVAASNEAATQLKDAGYNVYTIGFALTDRAKTFLAGGTYGSKTYPGIASSADCAKTANDAAGLSELFRTFEQTILNDVDITNATITDTIDPRFDLLDDNGKVITKESLGKDGTRTLANGGVVSLVNGNWQVQWTKVTIPNKKKQAAWSKSLNVKAKDTYIGGNDVTTNVKDESNIRFGNETITLPQPKVNVNAKIFVNDKEITIYKGDTIPTDEKILNQLFTESDKTSYANGKVGTSDIEKVHLQWYSDPECTKPIDVKNMATKPDSDTYYYLQVTYDAGAPSEESNANTVLNKTTYVAGGSDHIQEATNPNNNNNPYGIYKIHVISGQIDIVKKVKETSSKDRTFQFNVIEKTENGNRVVDGSPFTVTVQANSKTGTVSETDKAKLTNLSRGTYVVSEVVPNGYKITETDTGGTDCQKSVTDNEATFILGNGINTKSNVISANYTYNSDDGGVNGKISYTNEYSADLDLKKVDSKNNSELNGAKFRLEVKDGDTWKPSGEAYDSFEVKNDAVELRNLQPGLYKLTEVEAPKGYNLLGESIYFKVSLGTITLTDENGAEISNQTMWTLENKVLTIKNTEIYKLPSAGGPGIYGFTISGVAILATALLLFINNKRREEEAKRP